MNTIGAIKTKDDVVLEPSKVRRAEKKSHRNSAERKYRALAIRSGAEISCIGYPLWAVCITCCDDYNDCV
jgi:hypothetical protein